jgi:hypothetical protein
MNLVETPIIKFIEVVEETQKACQIKFSQNDIQWLPKSQIRIVGNFLYIPEWLVKEKDLGDYLIK